MLDDGRLTDGQGRTVDFKNVVIILTSNVGSHHIMALDDEEAMRKAVMEDLRNAFRPEFLNRLDETIIFHRLDRAQLRSIVDVQLRNFEKRWRNARPAHRGHRRGQGLPRERRVRPDLRRPTAQACDPAHLENGNSPKTSSQAGLQPGQATWFDVDDGEDGRELNFDL